MIWGKLIDGCYQFRLIWLKTLCQLGGLVKNKTQRWLRSFISSRERPGLVEVGEPVHVFHSGLLLLLLLYNNNNNNVVINKSKTPFIVYNFTFFFLLLSCHRNNLIFDEI
jgi:hypothetical protein